jgi:hypothetical protein
VLLQYVLITPGPPVTCVCGGRKLHLSSHSGGAQSSWEEGSELRRGGGGGEGREDAVGEHEKEGSEGGGSAGGVSFMISLREGLGGFLIEYLHVTACLLCPYRVQGGPLR